MTTCNGCGSCCDPVLLPYTQIEAQTIWANQLDPEDLRWTLEDLRPMSRKEAKAKEPWAFEYTIIGASPDEPIPFFYSCIHFDPVERKCMNYDRRPPVCRSYPRPGMGAGLPTTCSFRADYGLPVEIRKR